MKIRIEWLDDSFECDTCGYNYAHGARVYFDETLELDLEPHAACWDGDDWSADEVYQKILNKLGHSLIEN